MHLMLCQSYASSARGRYTVLADHVATPRVEHPRVAHHVVVPDLSQCVAQFVSKTELHALRHVDGSLATWNIPSESPFPWLRGADTVFGAIATAVSCVFASLGNVPSEGSAEAKCQKMAARPCISL